MPAVVSNLEMKVLARFLPATVFEYRRPDPDDVSSETDKNLEVQSLKRQRSMHFP
jgi:hypothetical protein